MDKLFLKAIDFFVFTKSTMPPFTAKPLKWDYVGNAAQLKFQHRLITFWIR